MLYHPEQCSWLRKSIIQQGHRRLTREMMWRHPAKLIVNHDALCPISVSVCCLVCPSVCWIFNKPPPPPPAGPVCLAVLSNILCQNKENIFLSSCRLVLGHWLPASCKVSYYLRARAKVQEHVKWQGQSWASLVHCRYPEIIKHCFPFRRANTEHKHWTAADDGNIPSPAPSCGCGAAVSCNLLSSRCCSPTLCDDSVSSPRPRWSKLPKKSQELSQGWLIATIWSDGAATAGNLYSNWFKPSGLGK